MIHLTLNQIIEKLRTVDPDVVVRNGFHNPHSYRGYYDRLCFEPTEFISVRDMLAEAEEAKGNTYTGWKGGEYTMNGWTLVHLNFEGQSGGIWNKKTDQIEDADAITDKSLDAMLEDQLSTVDKLLYT